MTQREREVIRAFLEERMKIEGYSTLLGRVRENIERLEEDMQLIRKFLEESENPENFS